MNYPPYGEIGCWKVNMISTCGFGELPTYLSYFRPELVKIGSGEKILCRDHYYNIGVLLSVSNLHDNRELLDYLVSRDEDNKLDIQEVLNLAFNLGTFMSALTANGYTDTGIATDTNVMVVEPNTRLLDSLMNVYVKEQSNLLSHLLS